mgnify:CR=1 FL=1
MMMDVGGGDVEDEEDGRKSWRKGGVTGLGGSPEEESALLGE